jgi:TRAP transporter 4TM/12TM fusion protein
MNLMNFTLRKAILVIGVVMAVFHLVNTQYVLQPSILVQNTHLGLAVVLVLLSKLVDCESWLRRGWLLLLLGLGLLCSIYVQVFYEDLIEMQGFPEPVDIYIGVIAIAVVLEVTRLQWGPVLPILSLLTVVYFTFGDLLPTNAAPTKMAFGSIISTLSIGLYSGLYGQFMAISANFIFLFMLFGALLEQLDGNRFFIEIGKATSSVVPGGGGLTAVVSSSLMGTVTGAAVANVALTGAYTIPIMKREGYTPQSAAAIEATASTGGQIVPPVMGSVAFLMAALLSVPYIDIVIAAIIPALLFYVSVAVAVYFKSRVAGIAKSTERADKAAILYFLPVFVAPTAVLVYLLVNLYSVSFAAFYGILTLIGVRLLIILLTPLLPITWRITAPDTGTMQQEIVSFGGKIFTSLAKGAVAGSSIAVVVGTVGILSQSITTTGAAVPLGTLVEWASGGSLFITLLMTAVICVILGCGIPTVGAFILVSAIALPILVQEGLDLFTASFFILYFAVLSAITPPVATAALAASAMAGSRYFATAWEGTKMAVMLYIIPFIFVYEPAMLAQNVSSPIHMLVVIFETLVAAIFLAAATQGYFLVLLGNIERMLFAVVGITLICHVILSGEAFWSSYLLIAGVLGTVAVVRQFARWRKSPVPAAI